MHRSSSTGKLNLIVGVLAASALSLLLLLSMTAPATPPAADPAELSTTPAVPSTTPLLEAQRLPADRLDAVPAEYLKLLEPPAGTPWVQLMPVIPGARTVPMPVHPGAQTVPMPGAATPAPTPTPEPALP